MTADGGSTPTPKPEPTAGGFAVGSQIEARYGGKSKWYRGKVAAAHEDGTYDIQYDDGDSEDDDMTRRTLKV